MTNQPKKPLRILHVLGALGHGGVEVWLMNMLRAIDRTEFQFDFAVDSSEPGPFDEEVKQLGGQIFPYDPPQRKPWAFGRQLVRILKQHGPYDVVHSHVHSMSGFVLRAAAPSGVPMLIAHAHDDRRLIEKQESPLRRVVARLGRRWIQRYATDGLACSSFAAASLFGEQWRDDPRWQIALYGFDFSRFARLPDRQTLRQRLGLPLHRHIVGQVGRLCYQKNHEFTIRVLKELLHQQIDAHLLLVGKGELESSIRSRLCEEGLTDRATVAGDQSDVAPYIGAMDCMIFPSHHEGLGIVALEAQAAGVPIVASDHVPPEAHVIPGMMQRLPLSVPVGDWVQAIRQRIAEATRDPRQSTSQMAQSDFSVPLSVAHLSRLYQSARDRALCQVPPKNTRVSNHSTEPVVTNQ